MRPREDDRRCELGRLLSSFMRFVLSVRLKRVVRSLSQPSGRPCGAGAEGDRLPPYAIVASVRHSAA